LQISSGTLSPASIDLTEETKRVELNQSSDPVPAQAPVNEAIVVPLTLTAGASGSLTVKGATAFYTEQPAP